MGNTPKNIIAAGLDKIILTDGVCRQNGAPFMQPGMFVDACSEVFKDGSEYKVATSAVQDFQKTSGAIVLEDFSIGVDVNYVFSYGEKIRLAWLRPGIHFWGRVLQAGFIYIGDIVGCSGLYYQPTDGTFAQHLIESHAPDYIYGNPMFGVAQSFVDNVSGVRWVLIRVDDFY